MEKRKTIQFILASLIAVAVVFAITTGGATHVAEAATFSEATEVNDIIIPEVTVIPESTETDETSISEKPAPAECNIEEPQALSDEEIGEKNTDDREISIYASWGNDAAPEIGDQITLHAHLSGYEGLEYKIRWQYKKTNADPWQDLGNNGETCTLTLTQENLNWLFRVAVDING
ncbi:MAG: hypothetical protein ACOX17_05290 [Christensenellales bacterium]|jgi:hypothetical protein